MARAYQDLAAGICTIENRIRASYTFAQLSTRHPLEIKRLESDRATIVLAGGTMVRNHDGHAHCYPAEAEDEHQDL